MTTTSAVGGYDFVATPDQVADPEVQARADFTAGLRRIADALDANPILQLPYDGAAYDWPVFCRSRDAFAGWVALLDSVDRSEIKETSNFEVQVYGRIAGVKILVYGRRADVCEQVPTGRTIAEVEYRVPDSILRPAS